MKSKTEFCIIITSVSKADEKRTIIESLFQKKLAACIQEITIGSHYSWNNELCHDSEWLLLIKTKWDRYDKIRSVINNIHSYEIPEIVAVNIEEGSSSYLNWIREVTK